VSREKKKKKAEPPESVPVVLLQSTARTPDAPWNIRLFITSTDRNELAIWDSTLSVKGRARRDVAIKFLRVQPSTRWSRPQSSPLGDNCYVIRFKDQTGFQHRLFGYQDIKHHAFVICFEGYEQNDEYHPADYAERIKQCRTEVGDLFDERTVECEWPIT